MGTGLDIRTFRDRVRGLGAALLLGVSLFGGFTCFNETSSASERHITAKDLCLDPTVDIDDLQRLMKPYMRMRETDTRYDEVMSAALMRVAKQCIEGKLPNDPAQQDARLKTIARDSRVDVRRRNQRLVFVNEVEAVQPVDSDFNVRDIFDVVSSKGTPRQQVVFNMLAAGETQQEIADHLGVSIGSVNSDKQAVMKQLKSELVLRDSEQKKAIAAVLDDAAGADDAAATTPKLPNSPPAEISGTVKVQPLPMNRVQSPIGADVAGAIKAGAEIIPTGGGAYAGPVMTMKLPASQVSGPPVDGIVMLPTPIVLQSNAAGEQEMVVSAVREIGEPGAATRTFALYAFCKDEALDAPSDVSRYAFKSEVSDRKVAEIVTGSDLRQPEAISSRLWEHFKS